MTTTTDTLIAACRRCRIPLPSTETLEQLVALRGVQLASLADGALGGGLQPSQALMGVMLAAHDKTRERLAARGLQPTLSVLVALGLAEGPKFGQSVKEWTESGVDGDLARYVRLAVAREMHSQVQVAGSAGQGHRSLDPLVQRPGRPSVGAGAPSVTPHVQAAAQPEADDYGRPSGNVHPMPTRTAAPAQEPPVAGEQPTQRDAEYLSQHIYGGKAAACFSADTTRGGTHTVRIEAAEASARRTYGWKDKISIQLSQRELPLVLAVFMQWLPKFEGKGHGEANSKWFTLENQSNKLFLSVNAKGQSPRAIPIMPGDGYAATTLLIRQMLKNDPFLSPEILLSLVRKEASLAMGQGSQPMARAA